MGGHARAPRTRAPDPRDPRPRLIAILDELVELDEKIVQRFDPEGTPRREEALALHKRALGLVGAMKEWTASLGAEGRPARAEDLELVFERAEIIREAMRELLK